jgi:ABC-type multidrug transport system fused ATPase/permease subunit
MAYLLRSLILIMVLAVALTTCVALGFIEMSMSHIKLSIPTFIYTIFAQAFVMFYFIGVSRLVNNIAMIVGSGQNLHELFENPPEDLTPYKEKVKRFVHEADLAKRQTIPWTMLMLILGMIAFLLGGAHDTNMVQKTTHSGVVYGFIAAMLIGFVRQWWFLGKAHILLRKVKTLFDIPDGQM